jgi:hypothetical protein
MAVVVDLTGKGYVEGDDIVIPFTLRQGGAPYDLSAVTKVWFTVKSNENDTDEKAKIRLNSDDNPTQVTYGGTNPGPGKILVWALSGETAGLAAYKTLTYDIQVLQDSLILTLVRGPLKLAHEVTLAT